MSTTLCTLPRDVLHLIADRYVSLKDRKALRCLSKHFHTTISSAPAIGPSQEIFRNVYQWDRYVCWWCFRLGSLEEIEYPETAQFDFIEPLLDHFDYDLIRNQWFRYETCALELQGTRPLFCKQCEHDVPTELDFMIHDKYHLWLNIMVNAKWRQMQSIGRDDDRQREYLTKVSQNFNIKLQAIQQENISVYHPFSPIGVKVKERKTMFLLAWNYCLDCGWHGQTLDRCQQCAQVFHIGGNSNCINGKRGHISDQLEQEAHADNTQQQQSCVCKFCREKVMCNYCGKRLCWSEIRLTDEKDVDIDDDDDDRAWYTDFCSDCYRNLFING